MPNIDTARSLLAEGRFAEASMEFEAVLTAEPKNGTAQRGMAQALIRLGSIPAAIAYAKAAVDAQPVVAENRLVLGEAYTAAGDESAAMREWETGLTLQPNHAGCRTALDALQAKYAPVVVNPVASVPDPVPVPSPAIAPPATGQATGAGAVHTPSTGVSLTGNSAGQTMMNCPHCRQPILATAVNCPYCRLAIRYVAPAASNWNTDISDWQEKAYNIVVGLYILQGAVSLLLGAFNLAGFGMVDVVGGMIQVALGAGLMVRNDIAAIIGRIFMILDLIRYLLVFTFSIMAHLWGGVVVSLVFGGISGFLLYLINHEND